LKNIEIHFNEPRASEYKEDKEGEKIGKLGELASAYAWGA
jgi:hypothetical protein